MALDYASLRATAEAELVRLNAQLAELDASSVSVSDQGRSIDFAKARESIQKQIKDQIDIIRMFSTPAFVTSRMRA